MNVQRTGERLDLGCSPVRLGGLEAGLRLGRESSETERVVGGDVSKDLAIQAVAGVLEAIDKGRVAHTIDASSGANADDPERAELALFLFTADVGEFQAAFNGFLGCLVELGFGEEVATRALENLFAAVATLCTPFYTGHGSVSFCVNRYSGWR